MELRPLFSSPIVFPGTSQLPFFLSCKSSSLENPKISAASHPILSSNLAARKEFSGQSLVIPERNDLLGFPIKARVPFPPIRAVVKRRKEIPFDNVIQRNKKLKLVMKIRKILLSRPDRSMPLRELGKYRRFLGLQRKRRVIALLKKFPAVFEIVQEGVYSLQFRLTPEAEKLYFDELRNRNEMEDLMVIKLRKLLMMSMEKRVLLQKIAHLRTDLGLPMEFQDTICKRYPQYFQVVPTGLGPALELTHWDPELAVSAAELTEEENRVREIEEKNLIMDRPLKFNRVRLPKGLQLSKRDKRRLTQFKDFPYISPYSDFSELKPGSLEKEKHACGVVHEMLSLTMEKRTLIDHLTHFREEFRFSQQLRGMLIRHPELFYVSAKGDRDSVFLREAYHDSQLIDKDMMLIIKEKMRRLVSVPRFPRGVSSRTDRAGADAEAMDGSGGEDPGEWSESDNLASDERGEDPGEWSESDNLASDELDDDDVNGDEYDSDWSDEGEDSPPDFSSEAGTMRLDFDKQNGKAANLPADQVPVPTFPDGRPRDRW